MIVRIFWGAKVIKKMNGGDKMYFLVEKKHFSTLFC
jgi:hypothetical protein